MIKKKNLKRCLLITILAVCTTVIGFQAAEADTVSLTFTKLSGVTGGSIAATGVYRADLSGVPLTSILSLTIVDNSFGLGGAAGQFSGFDLDAVKLSYTSVNDASSVAGIAGESVFDFSAAGTVFSPGSQRVPVDPKLFGTDSSGIRIDNSVATLGFFDGVSTTVIPGAFGFVSLGDGGSSSFNLTSSISPIGLYLYIGEVGDNGEVAAGSIRVSDVPTPPVPIPGAVWLLGSGLLGLVGLKRKSLG